MALKGKFDQAAFEKRVQEAFENYRKDVIEVLEYTGREAVNVARRLKPEQGSFIDRTGNLRNSIGFVIVENGEIIHEDFKITASEKGGISSSDAQDKSRDIALKAVKDFKGLVLVIVAGMNYTMFVQTKGKDVLISAELWLNNNLPEFLKKV